MTARFGLPRPERILAARSAYQTSAALAAAIRFDPFTLPTSFPDGSHTVLVAGAAP